MANYFLSRRRHLKKSQFQMAVTAGVTPTSIAAWEHGQCLPNAAKLSKVAAAYEVTIEQLLAAIDAMLQRKQGAHAADTDLLTPIAAG